MGRKSKNTYSFTKKSIKPAVPTSTLTTITRANKTTVFMPTSGPVAATKKENNVAPTQQLVASAGKMCPVQSISFYPIKNHSALTYRLAKQSLAHYQP